MTFSDDRLAVSSVCELFQRSAAENPDAIALRTSDGAVEITWTEYAHRVTKLAGGLAKLGVRHGDTIALMLTNRPEFDLLDTAAMHLGAVPFSVYNTLPADQIAYIFGNAGNQIVFCERQFLSQITDATHGTTISVICIDETPLTAIEAAGDPDFDFESTWRSVGPDDLATLIYTSGTTGAPKGVELMHSNVLSGLRSLHAFVPARPGDRLISYLPSAHIADRFFSHYVALAFGAQVTCVSDYSAVAGLLAQVRPTSFAAVPRLWEKLKAGLEARIEYEPDATRKAALQWAVDVGRRRVRADQAALRGEGDGPDEALLAEHAKAKELVLDKLLAAIGLDQVRWMMAGAAPIAPEMLEFFVAIGLPVTEVWGMSETCGGTINPPDRMKLGTVGLPMPGVELRVAEDGELLVRGACVMRGYRNEPEKTAEAIDSDSWLHTGDIGEIDDQGYVRIVDRKKELIINAGGKNMSPVRIENTLKAECTLVGSVVAIGDRRPYNVALMTLDPDALAGRSLDDESVLAELEAGIARGNERLARVEKIKRYKILPGEWQAGGDELTPTMKLKRKPIAEKYSAEIDELYNP